MDALMRMRSDATAAIGISQRLGLGKVRHLSVSDLWIQQKVREGDLLVEKLDGNANPSDLMTKALDRRRLTKHMATMRVQRPEGAEAEATQDDEDDADEAPPSQP